MSHNPGSSTSLQIILPKGSDNRKYRPNTRIHGFVRVTIPKTVTIEKVLIEFNLREIAHIDTNRSILNKSKRKSRTVFSKTAYLWSLGNPGAKACTRGRLGVFQLEYQIKARLDWSIPGLHKPVGDIRRIEFMSQTFPKMQRTPLVFDELLTDSFGRSNITLKGSLSAQEFVAGYEYDVAFSLAISGDEYYIKRSYVSIVEKLLVKTILEGIESFSEFGRVVKKWELPKQNKPNTAPKTSTNRSALISRPTLHSLKIRFPENLADSESQSATLCHYLLFEFDIKPLAQTFESKIKSSVLKNSSNSAHFHLRTPIVHIDPDIFSPTTFANSFSDSRLNISSLAIPSSKDSPEIPEISLDVENAIHYTPIVT
ncbi:hypothetical protein BB558_000132 [Smittium angustum]|uniref:Arrestin-like N-terminal domain-containing protein n=1 Tax=Smittium angustum TaxID=133377 RepID=A0A2U1J6Q3_SMIAN|nr:hypothetical protein BB558_003255 [Smittium angustum]PWA03707.1 hypothetical protein BB558_000132 [Smittium angustum]